MLWLAAQMPPPQGVVEAVSISEIIGWVGGIATAVSVIIAAWTAHRKGHTDGKVEERRLVLDESQQIVNNLTATVRVMETTLNTVTAQHDRLAQQVTDMHTKLTNQDTQITDLTTRMTDINQRHRTAVKHIAAREEWASRKWPGKRPDDLPVIPQIIQADIRELAKQARDEV